MLLRILADMYDVLASSSDLAGRLLPLYHSTSKADITVTLDADGCFVRATRLINERGCKEDIRETLTPGNPDSLSRRSGEYPRAITDKLSYVAGDFNWLFPQGYQGIYNKRHEKFMEQLEAWCNSRYQSSKVKAIYAYLCKESLLHDLAENGVLFETIPHEKTVLFANGKSAAFERAKELYGKTCTQKGKAGKKTGAGIDELIVRWEVLNRKDESGCEEIWNNPEVKNSWICFAHDESEKTSKRGWDEIRCEENVPLMKSWYPFVLTSSDNTPLISAGRDSSQYNYGPYTDRLQQLSLGLESADKAARALRYLSDTQGKLYYTKKGLSGAVILWANGKNGCGVPRFDRGSNSLFATVNNTDVDPAGHDYIKKLLDAISGIKKILESDKADTVCILELKKTTKGRLSITDFREIPAGEYCKKLNTWYSDAVWMQTGVWKDGKVHCWADTPSLMDIARYGTVSKGRNLETEKVDNTDSTYSWYGDLLETILQGKTVPEYMVNKLAQNFKYGKPVSKKELGIICSVIASYYNHNDTKKVTYMVDESNNDKDYMLGRIWGIAEAACQKHEWIAAKNRGSSDDKRIANTLTKRYMKSFNQNPVSTLAKIMCVINGKYISKTPTIRWECEELNRLIARLDPDVTDSPLGHKWILGYSAEQNLIKERNIDFSRQQKTKKQNSEGNTACEA